MESATYLIDHIYLNISLPIKVKSLDILLIPLYSIRIPSPVATVKGVFLYFIDNHIGITARLSLPTRLYVHYIWNIVHMREIKHICTSAKRCSIAFITNFNFFNLNIFGISVFVKSKTSTTVVFYDTINDRIHHANDNLKNKRSFTS